MKEFFYGILAFLSMIIIAVVSVLLAINGAAFIFESWLVLLVIGVLGLLLTIDIVVFTLPLVLKVMPFAFQVFTISSYVYGSILWLLSLYISHKVFGVFWLVVGLLFAGVGVLPIAIFGVILKQWWPILFILLFLLTLTVITRILPIIALGIISKSEKGFNVNKYADLSRQKNSNDHLEPVEKLKFWARLVAYKVDEYVKIHDGVYKKQASIFSVVKRSLGYAIDFGQFVDEIRPITDTWESLAVKIKLLKEEIESDLTENENQYFTILYEYVISVKNAVDIFYENQCIFFKASKNLINSNFSFGKFKYRIEQYNSAVENYLEVGKKLNDLNYLIF